MFTPARLIATALLAFSAISEAAPTGKGLTRRADPPFGWHQRAEPHPAGSSYTVNEQDLVFGMGRSTRLEPEGFTVALFKPDVAIDAMGQVLKVKKDDFAALMEYADKPLGLPESELFGNLWSVKHPQSDWPIDRLYVASSSSSSNQYVVSVYGHDGVTTELEEPVGGYTELPDSLNTIFTLGKEARDGYVSGTEDTAMVAAANDVLHKP